MGKVLTVFNRKGGVAKSTTAMNLATYYAREKNRKVLLIDLDSLACTTTVYMPERFDADGRPIEADWTIFDVYREDFRNKKIKFQKLEDNLWLIPTSDNMALVDVVLINREMREFVLKDFIECIRNMYDLIILDCPGSFGVVSTTIFVATDILLVPVCPEPLAARSLRQINLQIERMNVRLRPDLKIDALVLTNYDPKLKVSREIAAGLKINYGERMLNTAIHRNSTIPESTSVSTDIFSYERQKRQQSDGFFDNKKLAQITRAADEYRALAEEIMTKFNI